MAAPVRAATSTTKGNDSDQAVLDIPATVNAGDRLVLFASVDNAGSAWTDTPTDSTSDSWTTILSNVASTLHSSAGFCITIAEKIADGDEDGGTVTVAHGGGGEDFCGFVVRATGAHATTASTVSSVAEDADTSDGIDPAAITGLTSGDWLFLTFLGMEREGAGAAPTGTPTGYTFNSTQGDDWDATATHAGAGIAAMASKGATGVTGDNPSAWTWYSDSGLAVTVAIPAAAGGGGGSATIAGGINRGLVNNGPVGGGLIQRSMTKLNEWRETAGGLLIPPKQHIFTLA